MRPFVSFFVYFIIEGDFLNASEIKLALEENPVIAAVHDEDFKTALSYPGDIIFYLKANILTLPERIKAAHECGKKLFVHIDLADGIGKDRAGISYLAKLNADGVISTKSQTIKQANELGLITIQRFFALDSQGINSMKEMLQNTNPDFIEIMPGVITKVIEEFSSKGISVIASGLIETKSEVTAALSGGAIAVSTGKKELWYV